LIKCFAPKEIKLFQVFYNMSLQRPHPLSDHTDQFRQAADTSPKSALLAIQLMTVIAKAKPVNYLALRHLTKNYIQPNDVIDNDIYENCI
jgi:hypothetical protein